MRLRYYSFVYRCHKRAVDAVVVVVVVWMHSAHMHNKWNPVREQTQVARDQRNDDDDGWMALGSDSGGWIDRWMWGYQEEQGNEGKEKRTDRMKKQLQCASNLFTRIPHYVRVMGKLFMIEAEKRENWFFTLEANSLKWTTHRWTRNQVDVTGEITLAHEQYTVP